MSGSNVVNIGVARRGLEGRPPNFVFRPEELRSLEQISDRRLQTCLQAWHQQMGSDMMMHLEAEANAHPDGVFQQTFYWPDSNVNPGAYSFQGKFEVMVVFDGQQFLFYFRDLEISGVEQQNKHLKWAQLWARRAIEDAGLGIELYGLGRQEVVSLRHKNPFLDADEDRLRRIVINHIKDALQQRILEFMAQLDETGSLSSSRVRFDESGDLQAVHRSLLMNPMGSTTHGTSPPIGIFQMVRHSTPQELSDDNGEMVHPLTFDTPRKGFLDRWIKGRKSQRVTVCGVPNTSQGDRLVVWSD